MDLSTISEVDGTQDVSKVNRLLEDGWILLAVASGTDSEGEPTVWYSVGFPGREPEA